MPRAIAAIAFAALVSAPALADEGMAGKWQCDYGIRKISSATQSSAAWFEVTFTDHGTYHGAGKAVAAGSALPMTLRGTWKIDGDGTLSMLGVSEVTNRQVPFRFFSDRVDADTFKRVEMKGAAEYRTACRRTE
jgi:hypothetical protein